jgi:hypothetical protein
VGGGGLAYGLGDGPEVLAQNVGVVARDLRADPEVRVSDEHRIECGPNLSPLICLKWSMRPSQTRWTMTWWQPARTEILGVVAGGRSYARDQFQDPDTPEMLSGSSGPARLLVVSRGLLDPPSGLYPEEELAAGTAEPS